jgi:hypothetical protein
VADDSDLRVLWHIISTTPGASAQLALAAAAAKAGHREAARVHVAITADAVAAVHPDLIPDPIVLAAILERFFLAAYVN